MADESVAVAIRRYLQAVQVAGIHAKHAILFGSNAHGAPDQWSDIDLVVIAPELEAPVDRRLIARLWELRASTDARIEPIACGVHEWETNDTRPILEIARREGVVIAAGID